jgi:hypothetical protein
MFRSCACRSHAAYWAGSWPENSPICLKTDKQVLLHEIGSIDARLYPARQGLIRPAEQFVSMDIQQLAQGGLVSSLRPSDQIARIHFPLRCRNKPGARLVRGWNCGDFLLNFPIGPRPERRRGKSGTAIRSQPDLWWAHQWHIVRFRRVHRSNPPARVVYIRETRPTKGVTGRIKTSHSGAN